MIDNQMCNLSAINYADTWTMKLFQLRLTIHSVVIGSSHSRGNIVSKLSKRLKF